MAGIMRDCPDCPDICQDRHRKIWDLLYRVRAHGRDGIKGLTIRYAEQIAPGASGPGTQKWIDHDTTIKNQQKQLGKELKRYDNSRVENDQGGKDPCPPTPLISEAREWVRKPRPIAAEWQANNPTASPLQSMRDTGQLNNPEPVINGKVAAIAVGAAAVVAAIIPFDGPVLETALGSAAAGLWTSAAAQ